MIDDSSIKEHILRRRVESGFSQKEMAEKLGMDRTTYRGLEKGRTKLINSRIKDIADHLDITTEEIVLGYTPEPDSIKAFEDYKADYNNRLKSMKENYENIIAAKSKELEVLKTLVHEQAERIKDKDEMIALLKQRNKENSL